MLLMCPFCGGGKTLSEPDSLYWTGMKTVTLSWQVVHWCDSETNKFGSYMRFKGKTKEDAEAAWNKRK